MQGDVLSISLIDWRLSLAWAGGVGNDDSATARMAAARRNRVSAFAALIVPTSKS
jgi:hypothetical protein